MQTFKQPAVKVDPDAIDAMGQLSVKFSSAQHALNKAIRSHGLSVDRAYENHAGLVDSCAECKRAIDEFLENYTDFNPKIQALSRIVPVDPDSEADELVRHYLRRKGAR